MPNEKTTFEQALNKVNEIIDDLIKKHVDWVKNPLVECENAMKGISERLKTEKIKHTFKAFRIYSDAGQVMGISNHYVVVAEIDDHKIFIDVTAGQFLTQKEIENLKRSLILLKTPGRIIDNEVNWKSKFIALPENKGKVITYQDFTDVLKTQAVDDVLHEHPVNEAGAKYLVKQPWLEKFLMCPKYGDIFIEWRKSELERKTFLDKLPEAYKELNEDVKSGKITIEQKNKFEKNINKKEKEYSEKVEISKENLKPWEKEVNKIIKTEEGIKKGKISSDSTVISTDELNEKISADKEYQAIYSELNDYHTRVSQLTLREKVGKLTNLALMVSQYRKISSHPSNARKALEGVAGRLRINSVTLRGEDNALGALDESKGWQTIALDGLTEQATKNPLSDTGFAYKKQLIIQLQSDDISYTAANNLFNKHPKQTELMQWRGEGPLNCVGWDESSKSVTIRPLQLDSDGNVRIVLVGHGTKRNDGTPLFAGKTVVEIQDFLASLLPKTTTKIKGIHLDLVGCELADPKQSLENTLPGQLATWLMAKGDSLGIRRDALTVSARQYPVRVIDGGKKEILTPEFGWITKETARLKDLFHKQVIGWDATAGKLKNNGIPSTELVTACSDLEKEIQNPDLAYATKNELQAMEKPAARQLLDQLVPMREHPTEAQEQEMQKHIGEILQNQTKAEKWDAVVSKLKAEWTLDDTWLAVPETRTTNKDLELRFVNKLNGSSQWKPVKAAPDQQTCRDFDALATKLKDDLSKGFTFDQTSKKLQIRTGVVEGEGVNSLNTALLIQTLFGYDKDGTNQSHRSNALKVQLYAQLAQNGVGVFDDAVKLVSNINAALDTKSALLSSAAKLAQNLGGAATRLLNGINIAAIITELTQTQDPVQRAGIKTKLGLALISTGLDSATLAASLTGTVVAEFLAPLAVPLAGIATALPALVENIAREEARFDAVAARFEKILESVSTLGFQKDGNRWKIHSGAVVNSIDFTTGVLQYGDVKVSSTKEGRAQYALTGWDTCFGGLEHDWNKFLDVYMGLSEHLRKDKNQSFDKNIDGPVILPSGVSKSLRLGYDLVPFNRYANVPAYKKLRDFYGKKFIWGFNALFDYGIDTLKEERHPTPIAVKLDNKNRVLIVPTVSDKDHRDKLSYALQGNGATYSIKLPAEPVKITITASNVEKERWLLDLDHLMKSWSIEDGKIEFGALKLNVIEDLKIQLAGLKSDQRKFTIGGQTISFEGKVVEKLILKQSIGNGAVLLIHFTGSSLTPVYEIGLTKGLTQHALTEIKQYFNQNAVKSLLSSVTDVAMYDGSKGIVGQVRVSDAHLTWSITKGLGSAGDEGNFFQDPRTRIVTQIRKTGEKVIFTAPEEFDNVISGSGIHFKGKSGLTYARQDGVTNIVNREGKFIPLDADVELFQFLEDSYFCNFKTSKIYYHNDSSVTTQNSLRCIFEAPTPYSINQIFEGSFRYFEDLSQDKMKVESSLRFIVELNQGAMKCRLKSDSVHLYELDVTKLESQKTPKDALSLNDYLIRNISELREKYKISIDDKIFIKSGINTCMGTISEVERVPNTNEGYIFRTNLDVRFTPMSDGKMNIVSIGEMKIPNNAVKAIYMPVDGGQYFVTRVSDGSLQEWFGRYKATSDLIGKVWNRSSHPGDNHGSANDGAALMNESGKAPQMQASIMSPHKLPKHMQPANVNSALKLVVAMNSMVTGSGLADGLPIKPTTRTTSVPSLAMTH